MKPIPPGWTNERPLVPPTKCRWCDRRMRVFIRTGNKIYACEHCDRTEDWVELPKR